MKPNFANQRYVCAVPPGPAASKQGRVGTCDKIVLLKFIRIIRVKL